MSLDPVVINVTPPKTPWRLRLPRLPKFTPKATKILTAAAAVVISLSMITFTAFSVLSNNQSFKKKHNIGTSQAPDIPEQTSGSTKSDAALPGGGTATGVGGTTGTNSPVVTLTATPASVTTGKKSHLKWSVTNNPSSCTASEDWSGTKSTSGEEDTQTLSKVQTYLFTLTCKTATGTGFSTVSVGATAQGGTGDVAQRPGVTLAANPTSIYTGDSSTLTWNVTNNPTSCTASGDWSGAKSTSGPQSTGVLNTAKTFTYTLTCQNGGGSGYATATVAVVDPPAGVPIVTIASNPVGPVTPGTSVTLTWTTTNNPTSCVASGDWSGNKALAGGTQSSGALNTIKTYTFTITCSNSNGGTFDSAAIQVLPNAPSVALTVNPSSMYVGNSATLNWNTSNSPTSCTATGDWTGVKAANGSQSTGTLNTARTYLYNLSCTNAGGTGYVNNVPLTVTLPPAPVITLSANPIATTTGGSSTLTWTTSNNPTSCTASGDWSGAKATTGGTQNTGALGTAKTYTYTLNCSNAGGSDSATTSVNVTAGGGGVVAPVITISVSPTSIGTGSSSTLSWSTTNNPTSCNASGSWSGAKSGSGTQSTGTMNTAGSYSYTLTCSNSAGSDTKTATLTVIAIPVVSISVSPTSINTGGSSTITWSATNGPTCTAGGSWSGSKAASGSQTTGAIGSAGSYTYSLSCTNSGGTASNSATLTVTNPAPVYCSGLTPCYGPTDLAIHSSIGNCWGWNLTRVIDITSFRPSHKGGIMSGSTSTLENTSSTCDHDIHSILTGGAQIPGYKDSGGNSTHGHNSSTNNNSAGSALANFYKGYYDATKP